MESILKQIKLKKIIKIYPYIYQRDINEEHVNNILKYYRKSIKTFNKIIDESIIVIVQSNDKNLKNKLNQNVKYVIIDGQHRMEALRKLSIKDKYSKILDFLIDIKLIKIDDPKNATILQSNLANAKPMTLNEKLKPFLMNEYDMEKMLLLLKDILRQKWNNKIIKEIRPDKSLKYYFNFYDLENYFKNSKNFHKYLNKKPFADEIYNIIENEIINLKDKFSKLNIKEKNKIYPHSFHQKVITYDDIIYLTYYYHYYGYQSLFNLIENKLFINDNNDDDEDDDLLSNSDNDEYDYAI